MKRRHSAPPTAVWPWRPSIRSTSVVWAAEPGTLVINTVKKAKLIANSVLFMGFFGYPEITPKFFFVNPVFLGLVYLFLNLA